MLIGKWWGSIISLCIDGGVRRWERPCSVSFHDFGYRGWRMFGMDWLGVPLWGYPTPFPLVPICRVYRHIVHLYIYIAQKGKACPPTTIFQGWSAFLLCEKLTKVGVCIKMVVWLETHLISSWFQVNGELPNFPNHSDAGRLSPYRVSSHHWGPLFLHTVAVTHVDRSRLRGELGDVWYCVAALTCFKRHCFRWWRQTRPIPKLKALRCRRSHWKLANSDGFPWVKSPKRMFPQQNSRP